MYVALTSGFLDRRFCVVVLLLHFPTFVGSVEAAVGLCRKQLAHSTNKQADSPTELRPLFSHLNLPA